MRFMAVLYYFKDDGAPERYQPMTVNYLALFGVGFFILWN